MLQIINNVILIFLYNNPIYNALCLYDDGFFQTAAFHNKAKEQEESIRKINKRTIIIKVFLNNSMTK